MRIESSYLSLGVKHNAESTDSHGEKVGVLARPVPRPSVSSAPVPTDVTDPTVTLTPKQMRDLAAIEEMLSRLMAMPVKLRPLRIGPISAAPAPAEGSTVTFGDGAALSVQVLTSWKSVDMPSVALDGGRVRFSPAPEGAADDPGSRIDLRV